MSDLAGVGAVLEQFRDQAVTGAAATAVFGEEREVPAVGRDPRRPVLRQYRQPREGEFRRCPGDGVDEGDRTVAGEVEVAHPMCLLTRRAVAGGGALAERVGGTGEHAV